MEKYQFVYDYAPIMWLDENVDDTGLEGYGWFPSSTEFFLNYTVGENVDGRLILTSEEPLTKPYQHLDWFHGQIPSAEDKVPVYTTIYPNINDSYEGEQLDPVEMLLNPELYKIQVNYIYFFPYDWVKYGFGDHVGDLEHTTIYFDKAEPYNLKVSEHSWDTTVAWGDSKIEMNGKRPVVYNAQGTHATYLSSGTQWYDYVICDFTAQKVEWDLYSDLKVIFPFDWTDPEYLINKPGSNIDGINYLLNIKQWGNEGDGWTIFGEQ